MAEPVEVIRSLGLTDLARAPRAWLITTQNGTVHALRTDLSSPDSPPEIFWRRGSERWERVGGGLWLTRWEGRAGSYPDEVGEWGVRLGYGVLVRYATPPAWYTSRVTEIEGVDPDDVI